VVSFFRGLERHGIGLLSIEAQSYSLGSPSLIYPLCLNRLPERGTRPTTASPLSRADAVAEHHQATALT